MTWRRVVGGDVAVAGGVGINKLPRIGPKVGIHRGARRRRWQPRVMVVVVGDGGGSGKRWGTSQCVTFVTFQPRLLDLATRGRLLIINVITIKYLLLHLKFTITIKKKFRGFRSGRFRSGDSGAIPESAGIPWNGNDNFSRQYC